MQAKIKVLIIEDEWLVAEHLRKLITNAGYEVVGLAHDEKRAYEMLLEKKTDLVMLDIRLNGIDAGLALGAFIHRNLDVPFIYLTAFSDFETMHAAIECEPSAYLVKPFQQAELFAAIALAVINHNKKKQTNENKDKQYIMSFDVNRSKIEVNLYQLMYVEAEKNYCKLVFIREEFLIRESMTNMEARLPDFFLRIHKSYIVNRLFIENLQNEQLTVANKQLPIGRNYEQVVKFMLR